MKYCRIGIISFLLCLVTGLYAYADQVIYASVSSYLPGDSQFGIEVKGNTWVEVADPSALGGKAFGGPGDGNYTADGGDPFLVAEPYLIVKLPINVEPGESTVDGKVWVPWARMRVPADQNSFYWQVSTGRPFEWKPEIITNAVRWNDDSVNGSDVWYWQDNVTGNDGGINADIGVGEIYVRIGVRESDPVTFPTIELICFRNDGGTPTDEEALGSGAAVRPVDKLSTSWGHIKNTY